MYIYVNPSIMNTKYMKNKIDMQVYFLEVRISITLYLSERVGMFPLLKLPLE